MTSARRQVAFTRRQVTSARRETRRETGRDAYRRTLALLRRQVRRRQVRRRHVRDEVDPPAS